MSIIAPKKLIETALPLDAINEAAAREKSEIRELQNEIAEFAN